MTAREVTVVLGDYPHTATVKSKQTLGGATIKFPHIAPVHDAFDGMARNQDYDICEMAIGAFLQARDAHKPLVLLPAVMVGGYHHRSLYPAPGSGLTSPEQLKGRRVGVRSYSQTTGLWVRGWLAEEYGLGTQDLNWVVTERSHVEEFEDPPSVALIDPPLADALYSGRVDAAILGASAAPDLDPLLSDYAGHDRAWYERHGFAPINHMVVATEDMAEHLPAVVEAVYQAIAEGIDQALGASKTGPGGLPTAIRHGREQVDGAVELAAAYAYAQGLISKPVEDIDSLFAPVGRQAPRA